MIFLDITAKKTGKTTINIDGELVLEDGEIAQIQRSRDIYVHKTGVITKDNFLGNCNGDIFFSISFYIVIGLVIIYLIMEYKKKKKGLYEYGRVRLLGLIIFITISYLWGIALLIYDFIHGTYYQSIYSIITTLKDYMYIFLMLIFPLAFVVTVLVTISNLKLLKKEGKSLKNMLGILLGGFFCLATIVSIMLQATHFNDKSLNAVFTEYIYSIITMCIEYLECVFIGTCILAIKSARHIPKFDKDAIIILGCKIREDGTLTNLLKSRVDRAIEFSKMQKEATGKEIIFVPSGGKGNDEVISEAQAMKNYLIEQGIKEELILIEDKSKNTYENIKFSNMIINNKIENAKIAFSTTNYHVFRAGTIATKQNIFMEGIGAKTKMYYWVNAFIREFVATLVSERRSHIKTLVFFVLLLIPIASAMFL